MYDFSAIIAYIEYLKQRCGLFVSIHPSPEKEHLIANSPLLVYNFHENSYCAFIKRDSNANRHCLECQEKVMSKCVEGVFTGVCFAGVKERVYPISNGVEVIGFISVSGFKEANSKSYLHRVADKYGFGAADLAKMYDTLLSDMPSGAELDTLISPLCQMLELAYCKQTSFSSSLSFVEKIKLYIRQHRNEPITSADICRAFYCSRSFLSCQFNRETGLSIREYITELRITDAKSLLRKSTLSVTEIALLVGFANSNYFSQIFKKATGLSPLQYKKASRS